MSVPRYSLISVEGRAKAYPKTFKIPPLNVRQSLRKGMLAKVILDPGERIWVEVVDRRSPKLYVGALCQDPITNIELVRHSEIVFGPEHIAAIESPVDHE